MTIDSWKKVIEDCRDNADSLDLLTKLLVEQDLAKKQLTEGFGVTGMPWGDLVEEIFRIAEER